MHINIKIAFLNQQVLKTQELDKIADTPIQFLLLAISSSSQTNTTKVRLISQDYGVEIRNNKHKSFMSHLKNIPWKKENKKFVASRGNIIDRMKT